MAQKNATKLTVKNGRKSKDGMAYNANHNTLEATRKQQSHIDQERTAQNIYIQFGRDGAMHFIKGGNGGFVTRGGLAREQIIRADRKKLREFYDGVEVGFAPVLFIHPDGAGADPQFLCQSVLTHVLFAAKRRNSCPKHSFPIH